MQSTKIITITGIKGGIGKSTTAIHIANYVSQFGKTLLLDCDDKNRTSVNWMRRGLRNNLEFGFEVADERSGKLKVVGKDFLIIDTPANPNNDDFEELSRECDMMILPVYPDANSVESFAITVNKIQPDTIFRGLVTLAPPYPNTDGETTQESLRENGIPVFETIINRTVALSRAADRGCTVKELTKDKAAQEHWNRYVSLGKEIMKMLKKGGSK